jgi:Cytochrome c oxidase subunit IV
MADEVRLTREQPEPPGELIHLPGPSYLPVLTAAGIAVAVCGIVLSLFMVVLGAVVALVSIIKWIGETRREISELPLEHH